VELLPLTLIGWVCTLGSALALAAGAFLIVSAHLSGEAVRRELARRVVEDAALFGLWLLGLAGGIGLLADRAWARPVLELFCAALTALVLIVSVRRLAAAPPPRAALAMQSAFFALPIVAFCVAAIATLRSDAARALG